MKLLIDCTTLHAGGGVQVAVALLDGLSRRDDIDWLAVVPSGMQQSLPRSVSAQMRRIAVVRKSARLDIVRTAIALRRIERSSVPDVVFTVFGPAYFRARAPHVIGFALPLMIYEPGSILLEHHGLLVRLGDAVRSRLLRQADHIVVETETVRNRLARRIGYDHERMTVIANSVNPLLLRQQAEPPKADPGRFGIIVPSAYYRHKNLEILPCVAASLQQLDPALDFEFRLTLPTSSAPWAAIARTATDLGAIGRLTTLGPLSLDALAAAYRAASAVLLPTLREASTAVYPESFHFNRPLVTSDMDFARELCGDAALYAAPHNPEDFARQLARLARDPDLVSRQLANGQYRLASNYPTAEKKLEQQIQLLRTVCQQQKRPAKSRTENPIVSTNR